MQIAVTVPGDNSVDVLTNDIGIVVITDAAGELQVGRHLTTTAVRPSVGAHCSSAGAAACSCLGHDRVVLCDVCVGCTPRSSCAAGLQWHRASLLVMSVGFPDDIARAGAAPSRNLTTMSAAHTASTPAMSCCTY